MAFQNYVDRICTAALILLILTVTGSACTEQASPTPEPMTFDKQAVLGRPVYYQNCATTLCHGTDSEGILKGGSYLVAPLIGAQFLKRNPNTQIMFDIVRSRNDPNLLALTDDQVYQAIAFDLTLNQIQLKDAITPQNAAELPAGGSQRTGQLYPPVSGINLLDTTSGPSLPIITTKGNLSLRVDQLAFTGSVGNYTPTRSGGLFVIVVLAIKNLSNKPLGIDPKYLSLKDSNGIKHNPQSLNFTNAVVRFHSEQVQPQYSFSGYAIFGLAKETGYKSLTYDDGSGNPLTLELK
ncbi:MAG TPA: DUF4352 domain-containing protein [Anaerolineaceae bacterium]|nr:DUF4352 domain-containing protein [Anaerolineaceae bacterium]